MGSDCVAIIAPVGEVKDDRPDAVLSRQVAGALGLKVVYKRDLLARLRATHEAPELALLERAIDITRAGHEARRGPPSPGDGASADEERIAFFSNGAPASPPAPSWQRHARGRRLGPQRPRAQAGDSVLAPPRIRPLRPTTRTYPVSGRFTREQARAYAPSTGPETSSPPQRGRAWPTAKVAEASPRGPLSRALSTLRHFVCSPSTSRALRPAAARRRRLPVSRLSCREGGVRIKRCWSEKGYRCSRRNPASSKSRGWWRGAALRWRRSKPSTPRRPPSRETRRRPPHRGGQRWCPRSWPTRPAFPARWVAHRDRHREGPRPAGKRNPSATSTTPSGSVPRAHHRGRELLTLSQGRVPTTSRVPHLRLMRLTAVHRGVRPAGNVTKAGASSAPRASAPATPGTPPRMSLAAAATEGFACSRGRAPHHCGAPRARAGGRSSGCTSSAPSSSTPIPTLTPSQLPLLPGAELMFIKFRRRSHLSRGFVTLDELFEALTLSRRQDLQFPHPLRRYYWSGLVSWLQARLPLRGSSRHGQTFS